MMDVAAVIGALGAALLLLARSRLALLAGLALLGGGGVGLVLAFRPDAGLADVPTSPAALAALAVAGLALAGLSALLVRFPALTIPLLLMAAPLRPPLDPDPDAALYLGLQPPGVVGYHLPLYVVLAAAVLTLTWRMLRGEPVRTLPVAFAAPAAGLIALTAISLVWSRDTTEGINQLMLFWFPFAALVAVVARSPFPRWMPRVLALIVIIEACLFTGVGVVEWTIERNLFYTPGLERANATEPIFRVTSLFQDPSIYARHLVVAIGVALVALWLGRVRLAVAAPAIVLLAAGLYVSYSQSSMVALIVVATAIALAAGDRAVRRTVAFVAVGIAVIAGGLLVAAILDDSAERLTRNRSSLVENTVLVFGNHPLIGVGVGGQPVASRDEAGTDTTLGRNSSHTTPLTIAAELGVLGLIAYVALLVAAVRLMVAVRRRDEALGLGMAAVLLVLFVHALVYDGFFEEPTAWGVLAAAVAYLAAGGEGAGPPAAAQGQRGCARSTCSRSVE